MMSSLISMFVLAVLLLIPLAMMVFLSKRLQELQQGNRGNWMLILLMAWGFLWVGHKSLLGYLGAGIAREMLWAIYAATVLLGLLVYWFVFQQAVVKKSAEQLQQKVEEIGKEA